MVELVSDSLKLRSEGPSHSWCVKLFGGLQSVADEPCSQRRIASQRLNGSAKLARTRVFNDKCALMLSKEPCQEAAARRMREYRPPAYQVLNCSGRKYGLVLF